jgi:hypothetical protein
MKRLWLGRPQSGIYPDGEERAVLADQAELLQSVIGQSDNYGNSN